MPDIDKLLQAELKRAQKSPAEKPYFFAALCKGPKVEKLLVARLKIRPGQVAAARKEVSGAKVFLGRCFSDDGYLVFELPGKQAPTTLQKGLKTVCREVGGINVLKLQLRSQSRKHEGYEAWEEEAKQRCDLLERKFALALKVPAQDENDKAPAKLVKLRDALLEHMKEEEFDEALAVLDKLEPQVSYLLARGTLDEDTDESEDGEDAVEAFKKLRSEVMVLFRELVDRNHLRAQQLEEQALKALHAKNEKQPRAGIKRLAAMRQRIEAALDAQRWAEGVDFSKRKLGKELGEGGFGKVFQLSDDSNSGPRLVLKTYQDEDALESEVQMFQKIGDHPNIVRCLGVQKIGENKGLVLEELNGGDLKDAHQTMRKQLKEGALSHVDYWGTMQYTMLSMVRAVGHLHQQGIVHNDIKPENIMFDAESGQVKLIDLGTLRQKGEKLVGYSPIWAAPETLKASREGKSDVDLPMDAYTTGATAYQLGEETPFSFDKDLLHDMVEAHEEGKDHRQLMWKQVEEGKSLTNYEDPNERVQKQQWLNTQYVDFISKLMDKDSKKRLTMEQALEHPFLKNRLLDDEAARNVIKGFKTGETKEKPPQGFDEALELARKTFQKDDDLKKQVSRVQQLSKLYPSFLKHRHQVQSNLKAFEDGPGDVTACEAVSSKFRKDASTLRSFQDRLEGVLPDLEAVIKALKLEKDKNCQTAAETLRNADKEIIELQNSLRDMLSRLQKALDRATHVLASPVCGFLRELPTYRSEVKKIEELLDTFDSERNLSTLLAGDYRSTFASASDRFDKLFEQSKDRIKVQRQQLVNSLGTSHALVDQELLLALQGLAAGVEKARERLHTALKILPKKISKSDLPPVFKKWSEYGEACQEQKIRLKKIASALESVPSAKAFEAYLQHADALEQGRDELDKIQQRLQSARGIIDREFEELNLEETARKELEQQQRKLRDLEEKIGLLNQALVENVQLAVDDAATAACTVDFDGLPQLTSFEKAREQWDQLNQQLDTLEKKKAKPSVYAQHEADFHQALTNFRKFEARVVQALKKAVGLEVQLKRCPPRVKAPSQLKQWRLHLQRWLTQVSDLRKRLTQALERAASPDAAQSLTDLTVNGKFLTEKEVLERLADMEEEAKELRKRFKTLANDSGTSQATWGEFLKELKPALEEHALELQAVAGVRERLEKVKPGLFWSKKAVEALEQAVTRVKKLEKVMQEHFQTIGSLQIEAAKHAN
ncbi:MAG: protein kinase [Planctomycetia bacterium]|nr:protein kinase [Planctomycetia bacterium]